MSDWLAGCGPGTAFTGWTKDGSVAWPLSREWVEKHPEWRGPRTGYFEEKGSSMSEFDSKVTFLCGCTWSGPTLDALESCPQHGSPRSDTEEARRLGRLVWPDTSSVVDPIRFRNFTIRLSATGKWNAFTPVDNLSRFWGYNTLDQIVAAIQENNADGYVNP